LKTAARPIAIAHTHPFALCAAKVPVEDWIAVGIGQGSSVSCYPAQLQTPPADTLSVIGVKGARCPKTLCVVPPQFVDHNHMMLGKL
jgi:hypothetical protein